MQFCGGGAEFGCMDTNDFAVSVRDVKRYELLKRVLEGRLTLAAVTGALGVSYRQAKRLKQKARQGLRELRHGNRGRPPANKREEGLRQRVLALSQERYAQFNDTQFTEELASREGVVIGRETVRRWRREAGLAPKRKRRAPRHRRRRPRQAAEGLMMLWDGSPHHWLGRERPPCCLMAAMDDATSKVLGLLLAPQETSWAYLKLLEQVLARWGVPASVYQDQHSALKRNDKDWSLEEELAGRREPTQVGLALEALQIQPIFALSAQAKGRVERLFGTLQDRLLALLELEGITTLESANAYLGNGFLEAFNRRFAEIADSPHCAWHKPPAPAERERLLSLRYRATVGNDNAVRLEGLVIDIPPGPRNRSYAQARVEVRQLLDGRWQIYCQERLIAEAPATEIAEMIRTRRRRKGTRAAHDYHWVFAASAPPQALSLAPANARADQPAVTARRAGPGRSIKATRIA